MNWYADFSLNNILFTSQIYTHSIIVRYIKPRRCYPTPELKVKHFDWPSLSLAQSQPIKLVDSEHELRVHAQHVPQTWAQVGIQSVNGIQKKALRVCILCLLYADFHNIL